MKISKKVVKLDSFVVKIETWFLSPTSREYFGIKPTAVL